MTRNSWTQPRIAALVGVVVVTCLAAGYWFVLRRDKPLPLAENAENPTAERAPTCRILILPHEKRLNPERVPGYYFRPTPSPFDRPFPAEQVDNPVLFQDRYANVRFENAVGRPLTLYCVSLLWWPLDADLRMSLKSTASEIRNERERTRTLANLEEMWTPTVRDVAVVDVEVRGADGNVIQANVMHQSLMDPYVPSAKDLIAQKRPAFVLQPDEGIDLPMSLFGKLKSRERGLKPGTYTIRATVSYAEAPSGETKRITSEPVTVTVTEEHIKAAEAYWASAKK